MTASYRICVLGNSHLAAAKLGWEQISDAYPSCELTFFGAPWDMMNNLEIDGDSLVPTTPQLRNKLQRSSGGQSRIDTGAYDCFVLYGLQFGARRVLQVYRNFRTVSFEWRAPLEDLTPLRRNIDPVQLISERLFDQSALAGLAATQAVRIAGQLKALTDAPIALVTAPGFSAAALESGDWDGPLGAGDLDRLATRVHRLTEDACPSEVALVRPPTSLISHGVFTSATYLAGSNAQGRPDYVHTSPAYGAKLMACALETVVPDHSAAA